MEDRWLFRAKRIDNGEWIQGYLFRLSENHPHFIMINGKTASYEVDTKTICQCTGLKDKNGNMIFESDIVDCVEKECYGEICWNESEAGFCFNIVLRDGNIVTESIFDYKDSMKVIGNTFDDPELLEME